MKVLAVFLLLFVPFLGTAQQGNIVTGVIKGDDFNEPLAGVTVRVEGTNTGAVTDFDGNYSISVPSEQSVLVFTFIGFKSKSVTVGSQQTINVTLETDVTELEELVLVGYGSQEKKDLTGAIGIAKGEVLENRPIINVTEGLQGVVAGLSISPTSGTPGETPDINIRGATSINGGSPLVLVDGAQLDINAVNPDDIESVTVLKDAASAAIYGARAAFGVILITTKKGKKETKTRVRYSGNSYIASPTILPKKSNSYKFALYVNSMVSSTNASPIFIDEHLSLIKQRVDGVIQNDYTLKPSGTAYYEHANTDWSDLVFSDFAFGQNHSLSIDGGSEKSSYRASFAYTGNEGVVKIGDDQYKRFNFNTNLSTDLSDWMKATVQANFIRSNTNLHNLPPGHGPSIFHTVWRAKPTQTPEVEIDGVSYPTFIRQNPVSTLELGGRDDLDQYNLNLKGGIEMNFGNFDIFSNFTYNPFISKRVRNNVVFTSVTPEASFDTREDGGPSYVDKTNTINNYYAFDAYATYKKRWDNGHHIEATVGYNQEWKEFDVTNSYVTDLISDDIVSLSNATGVPTVADDITDWALRSGFARLNYDFDGRYLISLNGRYDGSSRFSENDRFGFFPSVSAGWKISSESFMDDVRFIDLLKIRASYGSLGNQNSSVLYPYVGYDTDSQVDYIINGQRPIGVIPQNPISDDRTWETVSSANYGLDLVMFNGKFDASFDWFKRTTEDMLVAGDALPGVYGATAPQKNAADLEVKGWELSVGWKDQIGKDFRYNINLALSDSQGEITRFENPTNSLSRSFYEGQDIGEVWGYETYGLFQSQEEIDASADHSPLGGGNLVAPGDVRYADLNNDGSIDMGENTVDNPGDRKVIGNQSPRYLYGIRGGINFKNFDMSFFFQGVGKRDYWLSGPITFGGYNAYGNVIVTDELYNDIWSDGSDDLPVNTDAFYFRPSQRDVMTRNSQVQSRYLQDASYLRLKNVTVGYTIKGIKGFSNFRIYLSGENLLTFTDLNPNYDPEALALGTASLGAVNFGSANTTQSGKLYPISKRFSLGLSVQF
ncbi:SusC/RagA family TonB-linked outer membrane protein [Joostella sp.]|uniref:SusC/RagA family TonB-linked outer membrane protein n=1 Tax=Joostella sp. TaxID=2231138 RepID=UPI003A901A07